MLYFWIFLSGAVFLASATTHIASFFMDPMAVPNIMLLHVMIFPPFISYLSYSRRDRTKSGWLPAGSPRWLGVTLACLFFYTICNFILWIAIFSGGGQPKIRDGKYVLTDHGKVVREINEQEYHKYQARIIRGFSGHWMLFSGIPLVGLVCIARLRQKTVSNPYAAPPSSKPS